MKFSFVLGTRPEVIKLAPVILAANRAGHTVTTVLTGQHREMSRSLLGLFGVQPDVDLDVMTEGQTLTSLSARILQRLDKYSNQVKADVLVVQGDTTSAFIASFWGFAHQVPIAHVEAGLRTYDLAAPFPEEGNRQLIGRVADFHFAPTEGAVRALRRENIPPRKIYRVGNTGIDALLSTLDLHKRSPRALPQQLSEFVKTHPLVLVTAHRRESFGAPFEGICQGLLSLAEKRPDLRFVYPVHPNPNVRKIVHERLGSHSRILLCDPLSYLDFILLMNTASLIMTDSGGVQEEAPSLQKPILVLRNETERPEGVRRGFSVLVGTDPQMIVKHALHALKNGCSGRGRNPYGDGKASDRIVRILATDLSRRK